MMKFFLLILILVILIFLVPFIFQRNFIYFPVKEKPDRRDFEAQDMEIIKLNPNNNLTIESWYKPAHSDKPTIVYLHGNGGHIGHRIKFIRYFLNNGFGVFLLEYRGYGGNPGKPTEKGFYEDARAALQFLKNEENIPSNKIILYGESLGTGVAVKMATETDVCAVILQSAYTKLEDLAKYHYPWLITVLFDKFDSFSRIKQLKVPILFLHGKEDVIVTPKFGLQLYNKANTPKKWEEFTYKGHNDLWDENFANTIFTFIDKYCK